MQGIRGLSYESGIHPGEADRLRVGRRHSDGGIERRRVQRANGVQMNKQEKWIVFILAMLTASGIFVSVFFMSQVVIDHRALLENQTEILNALHMIQKQLIVRGVY